MGKLHFQTIAYTNPQPYGTLEDFDTKNVLLTEGALDFLEKNFERNFPRDCPMVSIACNTYELLNSYLPLQAFAKINECMEPVIFLRGKPKNINTELAVIECQDENNELRIFYSWLENPCANKDDRNEPSYGNEVAISVPRHQTSFFCQSKTENIRLVQLQSSEIPQIAKIAEIVKPYQNKIMFVQEAGTRAFRSAVQLLKGTYYDPKSNQTILKEATNKIHIPFKN